MAQSSATGLAAAFENVAGYLLSPLAIDANSRLFFLNFVVFILAGAIVFWLRGRADGGSMLGYIFPKKMYLSRSSLVDLKVYLANHFFSFQAAGVKLISVTLVAGFTASLLAPVTAGLNVDGQTFWAMALSALLVAMANDFATYLTHRLSHQNRLLWPFHRLHHSAEVLTPLTVYRKHPVYSLLNSAIQPLVAGPVIGVLAAVFDQASLWTIFGFNAVYMIFNFIGANLRHSHIWIDFGPAFSRIFISPAMHQVHHSIDAKHYDRNYGEVFALWDWAFGTLYVPKEREHIAFGVVDEIGGARVQPHATLKDAYVGPLREFARLVAGQNPAPSPPTDVEAKAA